MSFVYILALGALQGLTEFLPVSSSAHLELLSAFSGVPEQGRFFAVAAHVGSLLAVLWHYRARVMEMLVLKDRPLALKLAVSFLPVLALGLVFDPPGGAMTIAWCSIVFGLLLWLADRFGRSDAPVGPLSAFLAGCAQVVALMPGVSRSGIVLTSLRVQGISREKAMDFAFLMSIPAIAAAGAYELLRALGAPGPVDWGASASAVAASFLFSLLAIRLMLAFVRRFPFSVFAAYRVALGVVLLVFVAK